MLYTIMSKSNGNFSVSVDGVNGRSYQLKQIQELNKEQLLEMLNAENVEICRMLVRAD